ncbi:MAG: hypothetical protein K1Y01_16785 [Vicinamibacteria bacterium]|nr:hypothetical protein [Vicinamibacteria bacterium]
MRASRMVWSMRSLVIAAGLAPGLPAHLASAQTAGARSLSVDAAPWEMILPDGGLTVKDERRKDDGRAGHISLTGASGLVVSAFIEPVTKCSDARSCRDMIWKLGNPSWEKPINVKMSEIGEASCVGFLIPSFQGRKVDQQNLYAEFVKDGYWIDLHLSYAGFTPDRQVILDSFVRSVRFAPKPSGTTSPPAPGFAIPGHGRLVLKTPTGWRVQSRTTAEPASTYLAFAPPTGDSFSFQITAVWLSPDKRTTSLDELRSRAIDMAQEPLKQAVEKTVTLRAIQGNETKGFSYSLTDRAAPAGEYKYLTQSLSLTGEVIIMATFLSHTMPNADLEAALAALSSASHLK